MFSTGIFIIWLIIPLIINGTPNISYNLPKLCPFATWNPTGITFGNSSTTGTYPYDIFIDTNNKIYVATNTLNQVQVWLEENNSSIKNPTTITSGGSFTLFVINTGDIYLGKCDDTVDLWTSNLSKFGIAMYSNSTCWSLFVDIDNSLYCSLKDLHQVVKKLQNSTVNTSTVIAGTGTAGVASATLSSPHGIFVSMNFDLYVADCGNDRIQKFTLNNSTGITVAGSGAVDSITLSCPIGIVLDADDYLFIADYNNHRILGSGPFGFRCIVGCLGVNGSQAYDLNYPRILRFDNHGNIYVTESGNHRIQKFSLATNSCSLSYNQPKFCPLATWNSSATTLANFSIVGLRPFSVFVDTNNTVYVADRTNNRIQVWERGGTNLTQTLSDNLQYTSSLFVTNNGDIYADNGENNRRVNKWKFNENKSSIVMDIMDGCFGLFIDLSNFLYCSIRDRHQVIKGLLNSTGNMSIIVAGTGANGSQSNMLISPRGIFVDINFDLYVADAGNNRIQKFKPGNLTGITVVPNNMSENYSLNYPTGIVLDADGHLFIVDSHNNRIVRLGPTSVQCLIGCSYQQSDGPNQLSTPRSLAFDSYGNIFVTDMINNRILKFFLATNSCDETTSSTMNTGTSTNVIQLTALLTLAITTDFYRKSEPLTTSFVAPTCPNSTNIGTNCNTSGTLCDMTKPCQNNGTCHNTNDNQDYTCSCLPGFNGTRCQLDHRPCKENTCWNNGICNETSDTTFNCICASGWEGSHCESKINYCYNITCQNKGICFPLLLNYSCECLHGSYSGRRCEITATRIIVYKIVSKSFGYVAIIAIVIVAIFVIIMDILKYCFGIDPTREDRERIRRKKQAKKRKPVIQPPAAPIATIEETAI